MALVTPVTGAPLLQDDYEAIGDAAVKTVSTG
jgi:hypothetical protein